MGDPRDAQVLGHELLLRMLVSNAKLNDGRFKALAMRFLDELLGGLTTGARDTEMDEVLVGAREKFVELLNTRDDIFGDYDAVSQPPPRKRRLFFWLPKG